MPLVPCVNWTPQQIVHSTGSNGYRHITRALVSTVRLHIGLLYSLFLSVVLGGPFPAWPVSVCRFLRRPCVVCRVSGGVAVSGGSRSELQQQIWSCLAHRMHSVHLRNTLLLTSCSSSPEIVAILRRVLFLSFSDCEDFIYELYLLNFPTRCLIRGKRVPKTGADNAAI